VSSGVGDAKGQIRTAARDEFEVEWRYRSEVLDHPRVTLASLIPVTFPIVAEANSVA